MNTRQILLPKDQFDYLEKMYPKKEIFKEGKVLLDDDGMDTLDDWVTDRLQTVGLAIEYNPTSEGMILESIIDSLYEASK